MKAILQGNFTEVLQIEKAYHASRRDLALASAQELNAIQDKYTAKQMLLMGFGPKKAGAAPDGGGTSGGGASTSGGSGLSEEVQLQVRLAKELEDIAAGVEKYNESIRKKGLDDWKKSEEEKAKASKKAALAAAHAWEQNTAKGGMMGYLRDTKAAMTQWGSFMKTMLQGIEQSFASAFKGILTGQMTLGQGMKAIWQGVMDSIIGMIAQMLAKWLMAKLIELVVGKEAAATEASNYAAVYAVNAMSSVAAIPVWGWAAAPFVGDAAYAAGMGFAKMATAAGGWDRVPSDQMAMIHKDEMVLPAHLADGARQTFAGGGGGGTEIHIHTVDAHGFEAMLLRNQGALLKVTNKIARNGRKN